MDLGWSGAEQQARGWIELADEGSHEAALYMIEPPDVTPSTLPLVFRINVLTLILTPISIAPCPRRGA